MYEKIVHICRKKSYKFKSCMKKTYNFPDFFLQKYKYMAASRKIFFQKFNNKNHHTIHLKIPEIMI